MNHIEEEIKTIMLRRDVHKTEAMEIFALRHNVTTRSIHRYIKRNNAIVYEGKLYKRVE